MIVVRLIPASFTLQSPVNNVVPTPPATTSLTSALKGMARRGHTEGLRGTMLLLKVKVRQRVHSKSTHDRLPSHASGPNAHVTAATPYAPGCAPLIYLFMLAPVNPTGPRARFVPTTTNECNTQ